MKFIQLQVIAFCLCAASAFIPHSVIKKYAMKKIAESCFGEEVIDSFKKEMHQACEECHAGKSSGDKVASEGENAPEDTHMEAHIESLLGVEGSSRRKRSHHGHLTPEKLEKLKVQIANMIGNMTCVMQKMKLLDEKKELDLASIKERITTAKLSDGLTEDLMTSVDECSEFTNCLPASALEKSPLTLVFGKQMMFFKCFKMAKIEACMRKDFREDYLPMLMRSNLALDEDESFQTIVASSMLKNFEDF